MISQFIRPATRLRPAPISVRRNRAFRPASVLGLDELESRVVPSVTLSVTAAPFYADPSGVNDSSAAIQNCINAVHADGGGTVSFPAGTYKISFAGAGQPTTSPMFTVPSNITLSGHSKNDTTIFVAPNQGDYVNIFHVQDNSSNVVFQDLTIDQNGLNNGGSLPNYTTNVRYVIVCNNITNAVIQRCRFTNLVDDVTIIIYGDSGSTIISGNTFDNVGLNTTEESNYYDHSTIHTDGGSVTIDSNTLVGRLVNGTTIGAMGASTAIELHGHDQSCTNNTISNYANGANICASNYGFGNTNKFVEHNTWSDVGTALLLWPGTGALFENTKLLNNHISVDVADWINYWGNATTAHRFFGVGGIIGWPWANPGPISDMVIDSNTITFTNYSGVSNIYFPGLCNGIILRT